LLEYKQIEDKEGLLEDQFKFQLNLKVLLEFRTTTSCWADFNRIK